MNFFLFIKRMLDLPLNFFFSYGSGTIPRSTELFLGIFIFLYLYNIYIYTARLRETIRFILIDMRYFYFFVLYLHISLYITLYKLFIGVFIPTIHKTLFHILYIIASYCYKRRHCAVYKISL